MKSKLSHQNNIPAMTTSVPYTVQLDPSTVTEKLNDLRRMRGFNARFDKFVDSVGETIQHVADLAALEPVAPSRFGLGMHFTPVEEDMIECPTIRQGSGEDEEVMFLFDIEDLFGRLEDGGVFPKNIPSWLNIAIAKAFYMDAAEGEMTLNCTFYFPALPPREPKTLGGLTREQHRHAAIQSYLRKTEYVRAVELDDMAEAKRHRHAALMAYAKKNSW